MKYYSYEVYFPNQDDAAGPRFSYGDYFESQADAKQSMLRDMENMPEGSTALVCRRDCQGEMWNINHYQKQTIVTSKK